MASYTPNLNLYKPDSSDDFGDFRTEFNNNMDIIDQNLGGGGGGGGHTIIDPNGSDMAQRAGLQFTGSCSVTDDAVNDKTIVNISGGGGSVNYSTSEQVIGTWIDGKPIYQKTLTHSGALVVDNSFSNDIVSLSSVDQFISCEGYFRRTNANGLMYSLNGGVRPESGADSYKVTTRFYNGYVQVAVSGYSDIEYIALTVRYTKTTD